MENNRPLVLEAFKKGLKVIDSCEKESQLDGARKFVDRFWLAFRHEFDDGYMNSVLMNFYGELIIKYDEKSQLLSL